MIELSINFVKRRWLDFRNGHAVYLVFPMTFLNFVVIFYTMALERVPFLSGIFPSMLTWVAFFTSIYIPLAIIIGHRHMKSQIPNEIKQTTEVNPYIYQTTPGKEQLFNLPGSVIGYNMQLKGMIINNQTADSLMKVSGIEITKWDDKDIERIRWMRDVSVCLQNGENILDILKKYPEPPK